MIEQYNNALKLAILAHSSQKRKASNLDYIIHPLRVANHVRYYCYKYNLSSRYETVALLHDVIEDSEYEIDDISSRISSSIASLVNLLTTNISEKKRLGHIDYFTNMLLDFNSNHSELMLVKLCDRYDNITDNPSREYLFKTLSIMNNLFKENIKETYNIVMINKIVEVAERRLKYE